MILRRRLRSNRRRLYKYEHYSPELNISVQAIRYTPDDLFHRIKKDIIPLINPKYAREVNKVSKKSPEKICSKIYTELIKRYFEWAIEKCIEGYSIQLFNSDRYLLKVIRYEPTEVELLRLQQIDAKIDNEIRPEPPFEDFFLNRYKIALLGINKDNELQYTDIQYFVRLPKKYKLKILKQLEDNPEIYGNSPIQFSRQPKSTKNLRLFEKRL